jgi:beta-glucanase (GH16 family)
MPMRRFLAACLTLAPLAVASAAATAQSSVPSGYVEVFGDEFDEKQLDTSKWWTRYIHNGGMLDFLNDEQQRYRESGNHVMTGHSLILMAKRTGPGRYESGMIRSKRTFKYGYFEARAKVPRGRGVWPAFWLASGRRAGDGKIGWPPEIDIAELVNNGAEDTTAMLHVSAKSNGAQGLQVLYTDPAFDGRWSYWRAPFDFADAFHVFAALWDDDDTVAVSVDGRLVYKARYKWVYDDGSPAGYASVLLNLAIGGAKWAGRHGVDDAAFPQGFEVDYVRVYQKAGRQRSEPDTTGTDLCPPRGGC